MRDFKSQTNSTDSFHSLVYSRRCDGLILLETYSTKSDEELMKSGLPAFLEIEKAITGDPAYSMYNLSLKAEWNSDNFEKKKVKIMKNYFVIKNDNENPHEPNNNELPNEKTMESS